MPRLVKLFWNHMDAWGLTLMIGGGCLLLHDQFTALGVALVIAITLVYWLGFAVNDYFDAPMDALDSKKATGNPFVGVSQRELYGFILVGGMILALVALFFFSFGWRGVVVTALGSIIVFGYSAPPLRLKSRPGFDLLTHAVFVESFPYFVCLFLLDITWTPLDRALLSVFLLASLAAQLEQQARDYELDRRSETNFTVRFGRHTTLLLLKIITALLILVGSGYLLAGVFPVLMIPFGLILLPVLLHRFMRGPDTPRSEQLVRTTLLAAMAYAGVLVIVIRAPAW